MRFIKNILECQVKVEKLYREYGLFDTPIDTAPTQAVELLIDLLSITTNDKNNGFAGTQRQSIAVLHVFFVLALILILLKNCTIFYMNVTKKTNNLSTQKNPLRVLFFMV